MHQLKQHLQIKILFVVYKFYVNIDNIITLKHFKL